MFRSRYSATVDLADLNNAHTLGILAVRPGSDVLDIGAADGSVARVLKQRGCRVWAIEVDAYAADAARPWCEQVVVGDVEQLDLRGVLPGLAFDAILFLDVLEHLRDPERALAHAAALLAPDGLMITSIPNVAHADVRLKLLSGSFRYTATGLLDRTHLRLFDWAAAESLITAAGLRITERLRVIVPLGETELGIDPAAFAPEAVATAMADPDAETYQFVTIAKLATETAVAQTALPLATRLQARLQALEGQTREQQRFVCSLQATIEAHGARLRELEALLAQRETELGVKTELVTAYEATLGERGTALASLETRVKALQRDLAMKNARITDVEDHSANKDRRIALLEDRLRTRTGVKGIIGTVARGMKRRVAATLRPAPPAYLAVRWVYGRLRRRA